MLKRFWCVCSADGVNMGKWRRAWMVFQAGRDLPDTGWIRSMGYKATRVPAGKLDLVWDYQCPAWIPDSVS